MSRQNKVNPGMYTQRGRLTQDDAARELRKQREVGSQHTWQPVKKDQLPRFESKPDPSDEGTETSEDSNAGERAPSAKHVQPARRMINKARSAPKNKSKAAQPKAARSKAGARKTAAKAKTGKAKTGKATARTTGKAKGGTAAKRGAKTKSARPAKRQAILARNVGGNPKPRTAAKRRKS